LKKAALITKLKPTLLTTLKKGAWNSCRQELHAAPLYHPLDRLTLFDGTLSTSLVDLSASGIQSLNRQNIGHSYLATLSAVPDVHLLTGLDILVFTFAVQRYRHGLARSEGKQAAKALQSGYACRRQCARLYYPSFSSELSQTR
jgi:hypothetical protein